MNIQRAKIFRDLTSNKPRSLLIIISVAVGVMAFGLMQIGGAVLQKNLQDSFSASHPAQAVLDISAFHSGLVENVRTLPYIEAAEARSISQALLETAPNKWLTLELHTIPDFSAWDINKIVPEADAQFPLSANSILLEQSLRDNAQIGDTVRVKTLDGKIYLLQVAGFANDLSIVPTSTSLIAYGYIAPETAEVLNLLLDYNRLYVRLHQKTNRTMIQNDISLLIKHIEQKNLTVFSAPVPEPGKQLLSDSVDSVLVILNSLGRLTLLLSAFLVTTVMFAVMNQQVRQIGILKSLGARNTQTMSIYFQEVLLYGLFALLLAIPLSAVGGYFMADGVANGMNMIVSKFFIPSRVVGLQIMSALLIPLLAALFPILNGVRITIREAIADNSAKDSKHMDLIGSIASIFKNASQVFNLSIRNTFRRPGRLILNFATLILAGAMFIAIIGIRQSLRATLTDIQNEIKYDVDIDFSQPYPKKEFQTKMNRIENVSRVESWNLASGRIVFENDLYSGSIALIAIPDDTRMTLPRAVDGRFLESSDEFTIFVNADTLALTKLKPDSVIRLRIGDKEHDWTVVGIGTRGFGAVAYVHYDDLVTQTGMDGYANRLVVQGFTHDPASQTLLQSNLLSALNDAGYEMNASHTTTEIKESTAAQMDTLIVLLMVMVILIAIVGGLGLAITMSLNVMERTREIGILRSLGAKNSVIQKLVLGEGLIIALISWGIAVPLSIPLAIFLGNSLGVSLLATPLDYIFSIPAIVIWLAIIVSISIIASLVPAQNATKLTIRDTLVYE